MTFQGSPLTLPPSPYLGRRLRLFLEFCSGNLTPILNSGGQARTKEPGTRLEAGMWADGGGRHRHGAQSAARQSWPFCASQVPGRGCPGRSGRGLSPHPGHPHLRFCSASASLFVLQCRPARSPVSSLRGAGSRSRRAQQPQAAANVRWGGAGRGCQGQVADTVGLGPCFSGQPSSR